MKTLLSFIFVLLSVQPAVSSDRFIDSILCAEVRAAGQSSGGHQVILQTNPTAWMYRVSVTKNSYGGSQEIASFLIPTYQPKVTTPGSFDQNRIATYHADGFELQMEVVDGEGKDLFGPAKAVIVLDSRSTLHLELDCTVVK